MIKPITNLLLISILLVVPAYAGERHNPPPEPVPLNVPDDGSNHNALAIAVILGLAVCAYHSCWKSKPVKAEKGITPEIPKNEYTYDIKP